MALPEKIDALTAQFEHDLPTYTEGVVKLMGEQIERGRLFGERFRQARHQRKAGKPKAGDNVVAYELTKFSAFNEEWINRYTLAHNQMIDKFNDAFSQIHKASDDPIYAQALWKALKLDDYLSTERGNYASMQTFKEMLKELRFSEAWHKNAQSKAISSMETVVKEVEYSLSYLLRIGIAILKGEDPTAENLLDYKPLE